LEDIWIAESLTTGYSGKFNVLVYCSILKH
jgi:hypothetical protein